MRNAALRVSQFRRRTATGFIPLTATLPTLRPQVYKFGLYLRPVLGPVDLAWVGTTLALGFGCKLADYQAAPHPLPAASYALQTTRYPKPYP